MQRAGRAARAPGRKGLAVLLVEPAAYSVLLTPNQTYPEAADEEKSAGGRKSRREARSKKRGEKKGKKKLPKNYARERGRFRGGRTEVDDLGTFETLTFDDLDPTEGLYIFIQSPSCRRRVLAAVFESPPSRMCFWSFAW